MNTDTKTKVVTGKKLLRLAKQGRLVTTKLAQEKILKTIEYCA